MENEKLEQLADMLGIEAEQIEVSERENEFFTPEGTYLVMDEDEAFTATCENNENFIYEFGISGFTETFQNEIKQDFIDNDRLESWLLEFDKEYAYDISNESSDEYANRLVEESIERGFISEENLTEDKDYSGDYELTNLYAERCMEYYKENYDNLADCVDNEHGRYLLDDMIKHDLSFVDLDGITSRLKELDGYGHSLAFWDGATNETADFYAFKQSDSDERTQDFLANLENDGIEY